VLIGSNQSSSMKPVLVAGQKVPQTLRQLHCQILQSRDTGCFFLYHRYTTAQLPLANTSNSRAYTVQLSAHGEPKPAVICEHLNGDEAFFQHLVVTVAILRLSFTPHCNKPETNVYTHTHTHTHKHKCQCYWISQISRHFLSPCLSY
jgi:hypothetical protein